MNSLVIDMTHGGVKIAVSLAKKMKQSMPMTFTTL